jgi:predicted transcriptional regulator
MIQTNHYTVKISVCNDDTFKPISDLQAQILKHVCQTKDADYKTISKETDRDRITILQSLQSLIKRRYIQKQKLEPEHVKSKLIFKPTRKGMIYAIGHLEVPYDKVLNAHPEAEQLLEYDNPYLEYLSDPIQLNRIMYYWLNALLDKKAFDNEGRLISSKSKQNTVKLASMRAMLNLFADKEFNPNTLFKSADQSTKGKHVVRKEFEELEAFLRQIKNNLDLTLRKLASSCAA